MKFYWFTFDKSDGLPVTFPAFSEANRNFIWFGVYGLQIGSWFFGTVKGHEAPSPAQASGSRKTESDHG